MLNAYFLDENKQNSKKLIGKAGQKLLNLKSLDLNVRDGFILQQYTSNDLAGLKNAIFKLEQKTKTKFGGKSNPLVLSIKGDSASGIRGLGCCDGIGLNDEIVNKTNTQEVKVGYLRLIKFYAENVCGYDEKKYKIRKNFDLDEQIEKFKNKFKKSSGREFPQDVWEVLNDVLCACVASNSSDRLKLTRELYGINENESFSIIVQQSVLGCNVLKGCANSRALNQVLRCKKYKNIQIFNLDNVAQLSSEISEKLSKILKKLEKNEKNAVKVDFFVKKSKIYVDDFNVINANKNDKIKIIYSLAIDKIVSKTQAVMMIDDKIISPLLHPQLDFVKGLTNREIAQGLPVSPGAACGRLCLSVDEAKRVLKKGMGAILVCLDTSPEELEELKKINGLLAARGGMTSHASVVARGMGVPCIVGCSSLKIDQDLHEISIGGKILKEGVYISIDGESGKVFDKEFKISPPSISFELDQILSWADNISRLKVLANADNKKDALTALEFGAKGIGLCRTEHMFFDKDRIKYMREMILASGLEDRKRALGKILPFQQGDFENLFTVMKDYSVTIRLLDPPLHEFLPRDEVSIKELAKDMDISLEELKEKIVVLKEFNPMMGHRGLRLAITYPEIAKMQTEAIIKAAINVNKKLGCRVQPEIMIPLTCDVKEFEYVKNIVDEKAREIMRRENMKLKYKVGSMIELPRACLTADKIAEKAEFFSFGTNDLSQMTFGMSRDDSGKFLDEYYSKGILEKNPFKVLDEKGVGKLIKIACEKGKGARENLKIGVCGEQGGDPNSIKFFNKLDIDYVSCSPFRVPMARVSTAQARIIELNLVKN